MDDFVSRFVRAAITADATASSSGNVAGNPTSWGTPDTVACNAIPDVHPKQCSPSFLVVGPQKTGTSSLYNYLDYHPQLRLNSTKEMMPFGLHNTTDANVGRFSCTDGKKADFIEAFVPIFPQVGGTTHALCGSPHAHVHHYTTSRRWVGRRTRALGKMTTHTTAW